MAKMQRICIIEVAIRIDLTDSISGISFCPVGPEKNLRVSLQGCRPANFCIRYRMARRRRRGKQKMKLQLSRPISSRLPVSADVPVRVCSSVIGC